MNVCSWVLGCWLICAVFLDAKKCTKQAVDPGYLGYLSASFTKRSILGAHDTGLSGQFSRGFLAHDMGFMYRFFLHMTWELCADLTGRYFSIY